MHIRVLKFCQCYDLNIKILQRFSSQLYDFTVIFSSLKSCICFQRPENTTVDFFLLYQERREKTPEAAAAGQLVKYRKAEKSKNNPEPNVTQLHSLYTQPRRNEGVLFQFNAVFCLDFCSVVFLPYKRTEEGG